jgi:hypothetical protein
LFLPLDSLGRCMHVGARLLGWTTEALSLVTAGAVMLFQGANPATSPQAMGTTDDTITWLFRGLLGVSLTLNAYFLKKLSDNVSRCSDETSKHDKRISVLERSYEIWLDVERGERGDAIERRQRIPGRRADDVKKDRGD